MNRILPVMVKIVGFLLTIWTLVALLGDQNSYNRLLLDQKALLFISIMLLIILLIVITLKSIRQGANKSVANNYFDKIVIKLSVGLAVIMGWVWCNIYFKAGWDVWTIDYAAKVLTGQAEYITWLTDYLSQYPNNLVLIWIYSVTIKINRIIGVIDVSNGQIVFLFLNTVISWGTVLLIYYCIRKKTNNIKIAVGGWLIAVIMIGMSPWTTIPYSDALTVGIPITVYTLYILAQEKRNTWLLYGLIGLFSIIGYNIKPQSTIVLIAIIMAEIFQQKKNDWKNTLKIFSEIAIGIVCAIVICNQIISTVETKIPIEKENAFTYTHWLMMGTNEETKGRYRGADCDYSASFATKNERSKANLAMTRERIKNYGVRGYLELLTNKLAMTYDDGTFSWFTGTGEFATEIYDEKNYASKVLRECFYYDGKYYSIASTGLELIWFWVLLVCLLGLCGKKENATDIVLQLTVLGTVAFELIFEVFARHLYCNIPIYIVLAMCSFDMMTKTLYLKYERKHQERLIAK